MTQELENARQRRALVVSVQSGLCMYPISASARGAKAEIPAQMALGEILGCLD